MTVKMVVAMPGKRESMRIEVSMIFTVDVVNKAKMINEKPGADKLK